AALKAGDVDIVYLLSGPTAEEVKRTGAAPGRGQASGRRLPRSAGAVGPEVAVARSPRAPGGQPRPRPQRPQPGGDARALAPDGCPHTASPGVFTGLRAAGL